MRAFIWAVLSLSVCAACSDDDAAVQADAAVNLVTAPRKRVWTSRRVQALAC
jgi:hypothetical protein